MRACRNCAPGLKPPAQALKQPGPGPLQSQCQPQPRYSNPRLPFKQVRRSRAPVPPVIQAPVAVAVPLPAAAKPAKAKSDFPLGLVIGLGVVVLIAAAGAGYWFFLRPAPVVPLGALELNATPFAEVVSITSDKGNAIPLSAGDHWTPMRLDGIPAGKYTVSFKGADGVTQGEQCEAAQTVQVCNMVMKAIDRDAIDEIIGGAK
jgi:hypothetical protein